MRNKAKYVVSILMAASIGILFLPIVDFSYVKVSMMEITKLGIGRFSSDDFVNQLIAVVGDQVKGYAFGVMALVFLILAAAFLVTALRPKAAYIVGIIGEVLVNLTALGLFVVLKITAGEIEASLSFFGMRGTIPVLYSPVILWVFLHIICVVLCIVGMVSAKQAPVRVAPRDDILPETFHERQNPWGDAGSLSGKGQILDRIDELEKARNERKPEEPKAKETQAAKAGGEVLGQYGAYAGKAYPLEAFKEMFFCEQNGMIEIVATEEGTALAAVHYVPEDEEYRVRPAERLTVFLESGQPLGRGREYHLPKGTRIYLKESSLSFMLA